MVKQKSWETGAWKADRRPRDGLPEIQQGKVEQGLGAIE